MKRINRFSEREYGHDHDQDDTDQIEDMALNSEEVNESFRRGLQDEGNHYLERVEKMVLEDKQLGLGLGQGQGQGQDSEGGKIIRFFDNLNRKLHQGNKKIEILTEFEKLGFGTETLQRLGTIVIESSPKTPDPHREIRILRNLSDRSDDKYADDEFEEYNENDFETYDEQELRAKTAQITPTYSDTFPDQQRSKTAPSSTPFVPPLKLSFPNHISRPQNDQHPNSPTLLGQAHPTSHKQKSNHSSIVKSTHRSLGWIKRGEWRLGEKIGSGSFGEVFQGMSDDGHLFAVKRMNIVNNKEIANLTAEIELMQSLDHPNIVKYLGAKVDEVVGVVYIFQEWVPGGSVDRLLKNYGVFSFGVIRNYTRQILNGLNYLHSNGIVHRDIKGGNILVEESTVKLADFGASTTISLGETVETSTIKGTPYFMAPEVLSESKYGRRGDIWAVGCTIIQMLTGEPPWKERKLQSLIQLHMVLSSWVGIPPLNRQIPDDLRNFLELCFARNPRDRPMASALLEHTFLLEESPDGIDSLGSSSGIDIRAQLERAAAAASRASFRPDEASEEIQSGVGKRYPIHTESPRVVGSDIHSPPLYPLAFQQYESSPPQRIRQSSTDSSGSENRNPFGKKSTTAAAIAASIASGNSPSANNPFGRGVRASTNSISPASQKSGGMMPSPSLDSLIQPPVISTNVGVKLRFEPPPITKIKAWSPSDISNEENDRHHSEIDDLQYSNSKSTLTPYNEKTLIEKSRVAQLRYNDGEKIMPQKTKSKLRLQVAEIIQQARKNPSTPENQSQSSDDYSQDSDIYSDDEEMNNEEIRSNSKDKILEKKSSSGSHLIEEEVGMGSDDLDNNTEDEIESDLSSENVNNAPRNQNTVRSNGMGKVITTLPSNENFPPGSKLKPRKLKGDAVQLHPSSSAPIFPSTSQSKLNQPLSSQSNEKNGGERHRKNHLTSQYQETDSKTVKKPSRIVKNIPHSEVNPMRKSASHLSHPPLVSVAQSTKSNEKWRCDNSKCRKVNSSENTYCSNCSVKRGSNTKGVHAKQTVV